ncbi:MAG: glycosyltransferase family 1 protein [Deltaproteobacteria bacterium]|nr:glycosyltransferase family 1 protein [Deltaproteobacteria bacterium]
MNILFLPLEFPVWKDASKWGYGGTISLVEAITSHRVNVFTVPTYHPYGGHIPSFVDHIRSLCTGMKFDQVWIEFVHSALDDSLLNWLRETVPVRLGWSFESLEIFPEEWKSNPEGCRKRELHTQQRLPWVTHLLATDEADVERIARTTSVATMAFPPGFAVPRRCVNLNPPPPSTDQALFFGTAYGERKQWLEHPVLQGLLGYRAQSPEWSTQLPALYDQLHQQIQGLLVQPGVNHEMLTLYQNALLTLRRECFDLWQTGLREGIATVNLPQRGKAYAGRVVESMAAGRPVIAARMVDRTRSMMHFEDGKEILLYSTPEELAEKIRMLQKDKSLAQAITSNATKKVLAYHTTEGFLGTVFPWLQGRASTTY